MNFLHRRNETFLCCLWAWLMLVSCEEDSKEETGVSGYWPVLLAAVAHACVSIGALVQLIQAPGPIPRHLPRDVIPLHYNVDIIAEYGRKAFSGHEVIVVKTLCSTSNIFLHVKHVLVDHTSLSITDQLSGERVPVWSLEPEEQNQWLVITLASQLLQDRQYIVSMQFSGVITDSIPHGILRHSFNEAEDRWILVTHFEPTGARHVFPCFDEPSFKATFNMSIATPPGKHALSNMPLRVATEPVTGFPGWVWSRFEQSVLMSTYHVGFIVSDLVSVRGDRNFSVWVQKGKEPQASLMLKWGPLMLQALEEYTGIPNMLPKQDNIAIPYLPSMAAVMGTENWGLITYRDDFVIFNEHEAYSRKKRTMVHILAHELAHNWFGNLVTPQFWDELWLKEGFARYLQFHISGKVLPTWEMEKDFQIFVMHRSLSATDHSVLSEIANRPKELESKYNIRSYDTGAAVIHMLEHVLTPETFRTGIRLYLNTYAYQSATSKQLFDVLESAAANSSLNTLPPGVSLNEVMKPWISQSRHPLVTVTRDYSTGQVTVCQSDVTGGEQRWWIPLSYTTQTESDFNNTAPLLWLSPAQSCVNVTGEFPPHEWIIFNILQTGYYRVNYDEHNWHLLAKFLNSEEYHKIHILNRAQLLDDLTHLFKSKEVSAEVVQEVMLYLVWEKSPGPWVVTFKDFMLDFVMDQSSMMTVMQTFYSLLEGLSNDIPSRNTPQLWEKSLETSCNNIVMPQCVEDAYKHLKAFQANPANYSLHPDVKDIVFCDGLKYKNATGDDVLFLWKLAQTVEDHNGILANLQWCSNKKDQIHSLMVAIVTDGEWLTSIERTRLTRHACVKNRHLILLDEVLATLHAQNPTADLYLLHVATKAFKHLPNIQNGFAQTWCRIAMSWLTGDLLFLNDGDK